MTVNRQRYFNITLLRHGESVGNAESRWQGQADFPLTDVGREQAKALAERWKREKVKFDFIISSPLSRARETAEIIGAQLGLLVEFDPLWLERDNGEFAGLTAHEVRSNFSHPEFTTPYDSVGMDGEGDWELFLRAGQALHDLLKREPARYLIVSHGGLLNQLMHAIVGIIPQAHNSGASFRFSNTAFAQVIYSPNQHRWMIDKLNDHNHWLDAESEGRA
ncbi:MAG: histidine phosphatase family protein [Anaerolineales bacterium]|nr:MAG: histidine phosphatase family protein [Chloroflexota bacterium]MBE7434134.1 histidine phosphatase family protein [Anaerolineales bacterium]MCE7859843.1 histidine phosphatase family protein [Chloroflexi bacterium CFX2]GJQ36968.1 MAG: phosphoglycerate mutase [Anaerolineaceae bacterium]